MMTEKSPGTASAVHRRRLACRLCTRRKVKCDKKVPCHNCVRRGTPAECERGGPEEENLQMDKAPGNHQANDASTLNALQNRVTELEEALQQANAKRASSLAELTTRPTMDQGIASSPSVPIQSELSGKESDVQDAVTVLEFLAWGRMKDPNNSMLSPEALKASEHEDVVESERNKELDYGSASGIDLFTWLQILLPSRNQVLQLVQYHNECLLWFHGSYFAPSFSTQLSSFYTDHLGKFDSDGVDLQWVALLFSIIAGTMVSAPVFEARKWGFSDGEARLLSQKWYKAVVVSLNAANFSAQHSLYSVQAIAVLTHTAHMLGHSNTQSVLLASAVRIAQSLGLHRLHADAHGTDIEIETGRRVWQELCTQDWFSTSFSESYSINPLHSMSLPPKNCNEDMMVLPESEPTITSFSRFLAKIAAIMPALQDAMALANTLYTKHSAVLTYDKKMRSLATGRPAFLANTSFHENWPCYIQWARRAITMSSAHKIIMIHRKFIGLSFTNSTFAFTRRTCVAAANTIMKEFLASSRDESSPMLWTYQAFAVAACIIACFDALHSPDTTSNNYELVDQTLTHLQLCQSRSMIAARGVKVLNALQKQMNHKAETRKRPSSHSRETSPRKRHRGFDAAEFARSFRDLGDENGPDSTMPQLLSPVTQESHRSGQVEDNLEAEVGNELFAFQPDMNWLNNIPLGNEQDSQTLDYLLSLANHGLVL